MIESLNEYWNRAFNGCPPIGHLLRSTYPERWVRFHSLPESKRYAETESEYTEILKRQNRLLCDIAGQTEIVLLTTSYNGSSTPPGIECRGSAEILLADPEAKFWRSLPMHEIEDDDEPRYWHVFASRRNFTIGSLDPVLRLVADDIESNVILLSLNSDWLIHPYDGGIDLILQDSNKRDTIKERYQSWLSKHPRGL